MAEILIAHTTYPSPTFPDYIGGAEHSQVHLAQGLADTYGHRITILRGLPPGTVPLDESDGDIRILSRPIRRPYWLHDGKRRNPLAKFVWHLLDDFGRPPEGTVEILDRLRPDLLILGNIIGLGHGLARMAHEREIPTLQIARDYYYVCPRQTRFHKGQGCKDICHSCRLTSISRRNAFRQIDRVVAVSDHMGKVLGKLTGRNNVVTIHNGIEPGHAPKPKPRGKSALRLGYIGRLAPEKGIELLLGASARFGNRVELEIAGDGQEAYVDELKRIAPPQARFLGHVKAPQDFLSSIDLLVVPSLWDEPFGRVSIEAQLRGVAVIVSNRGGLPETLAVNVSGLVVEPTEHALAEAIGQFLENPDMVGCFGAAARRHALAFSHANTIRLYEAQIQAMLT